MNQKEQNAVIAEFCGWRPSARLVPVEDAEIMPDYCNDLNAMHEAEEKLSYDLAVVYCGLISMLTGQIKPFKPAGIQGAICHATAAQRAEALLKTIGKWKPEAA